MSLLTMRTQHPNRRRLAAAVATLTAFLVGALGAVTVLPAAAAPGDPEFMAISKTVAPSELTLGEPFSYTITVSCSQESCVDAVLLDQLPPELDGYLLQNVTSTPPNVDDLPRTVEWNVDGAGFTQTAPATITADTVLRVTFDADLGGDQVGMQEGASFSITLSLQVPDDLLPGEQVITNLARTESANAEHVDDSADITVVVPRNLAVEVDKSWAPSPQSFEPGAPSAAELVVRNASNGPVETLVLQEPATAPEGAATLDASNPFTITDFAGFSDLGMPSGADAVQVDAYVLQGSAWQWVTGEPAATLELPEGVTAEQVGGVRLTFTGQAIAQEAEGKITLDLVQRATHRDTDADLSTASHTVTNVAQGSAAVEGRDPATATGTATYTVNPVELGVDVDKDITPHRMAAGDTAAASILVTNSSDAGVSQMRVADLDYFTDDITFGGFTAAPTWPTGATGAEVRYVSLADGSVETVSFGEGDTPAGPTSLISGFEIVYTGTGGSIEPGASSQIKFDIVTLESAAGGAGERETSNQVDAEVVAPNGNRAEGDDAAALTLVTPEVEVELDKTISPKAPDIEPGDGVAVSLRSTMTMISDYIEPTRLVIEDALTADERFWDAFDLAEIGHTQIPSSTALTVEVQLPDGSWHGVATEAAQVSPYLFAMTGPEITAELPSGIALDDLTGVRFTLDNSDGFAQDTIVTPVVAMTARATLRQSGEGVTAGAGEREVYENLATVTGTGRTTAGTPLTDEDADADEIRVYTPPGGPGPLDVEKDWLQSSVSAQSGQVRATSLDWRVRSGFDRVVITDPAEPSPVAGTTFDAFDLVAVRAIPASDVPFTNGWYLRYDTITAVELYDGTTWTAVPAPTGGWVQDGAFVGYELGDAEADSTTAVRLTVEENVAARQAAADAVDATDPAFDPYAPAPGTGVAQSSVYREFVLDWQIRSTKRSDGAWVTASAEYNVTDRPGTVNNEVLLEGVPPSGPTVSDRDDSSIQIIDPDPGVLVTKSVTPDTAQRVPIPGTSADQYPSVQFRIEARNNSVARAQYVRVMDSPLCTDAPPVTDCATQATVADAVGDPFAAGVDWFAAGRGNPFDQFDLRGLTISASIPDEVDLDASRVWLLRYDAEDDTFSTTSHSATEAAAMTPAELADVVGVSVTFQDDDPQSSGGTITDDNVLTVVMDARLRTHERVSGDPIALSANETEDVINRVAAQPFDLVLNDGVAVVDVDDATARLEGGVLTVAATKSISPATLLEPQRDTEVTVTLGANHSTSTLAPAEVVLTDDVNSSPEFWDNFDLTGLGTITPPAGADRVVVSVFGPFGAGGTMEWVNSPATAVSDAELPVAAAQYGEVQGVRFTFDRADGEFFSSAVPSQAWSTTAQVTAQLRDELRSNGAPITMSGTIENTVKVVSDRRNGESAEGDQSASISLSTGDYRLSVRKLTNGGNRFGVPGTSYPWDLTFENTGTGYLTITELRDTLPDHLVFLGDTVPEYTVDPDGLLPEPESYEMIGSELVFTWPDGGRRMAPGEQFSVRVMLELQAGLTTGQRTTNEFTVSTQETLASCSNIVAGGETTDAWFEDPSTCGTTDYIQPATGKNLYTVKGVRGELDGAVNPVNPDAICTATLSSGGEQFYRSPCAANSVVDGVDSWLLRVQNSGTESVDSLVVFDQLPQPGDQMLIGGAQRGSQFRPQLEGPPTLTVPAGVTYTLETSADAGVCAGTWSNLANHEPCEQNGETWVEADADTDWSQVRGVRITFDFSGVGGAFEPGQTIDITYDSRNVPASSVDPDGTPVVAPVEDAFAWNQFGVKHHFTSDSGFSKLTPSRVGTHLITGPIQIDKEITGPAARYAAEEFLVDLACTVAGAPIDLGEHAVLELTEANGWSQRVDGVPVGAECLVTEQGEVGEFGETNRTGSPSELAVELPQTTDGEVPEAQVATITNEYLFSGLQVRKALDTEATVGSFGPFDFTLTCTAPTGVPVDFGTDETTLEFQLRGGEVFAAPTDTIPAGSQCLITEVGTGGADGVTVVGTSVTDHGDGSATVEVGVQDAEVTFTNGFDSGVLRVEKVTDGDGAALYGTGPFGFEVACTYAGETVLDEAFTLEANTFRTFGTFPVGTWCSVEETAAGGATSSSLVPETGVVTISEDTEAQVVATNTFDLGAVEVTKVVEGDDDGEGAAGPFTVELACSWTVDGAEREIDVPGGATRVLRAPDALDAVFDQLPVGAHCTITETEAQGADETSIEVTASDGTSVTVNGTAAELVVDEAGTAVSVLLTNVFTAEDDEGSPPSEDDDPPADGDLPLTGFSPTWLVAIALLAVAAGIVLFVARRRMDADSSES